MSNIEAEVINAVCKNKDIGPLFQEDAGKFFNSHADVWAGIKSYYRKYKAVPEIETLQTKFDTLEKIETVEPTEYYVDRLREHFLKSSLQTILLKSGQSLTEDSAARTLEGLQGAITKLSAHSRTVKDKDITDYEGAIERFNNVRQRAEELNGSPGIKTNIKTIDEHYPTGMAPGHLIYIIGYTGRMKTFFTMNLAVQAWEQGFHPMLVSLEMNVNECQDRVFGLMGQGQWSISSLQKGYFDEDKMREWGKKKLDQGGPFTVISNEGMGDVTPDLIAAKAGLYKPDIIIIDYVQLAIDNKKSKSLIDRNTNLTNELKQLSMRLGVPIIAISAVTQDENTSRKNPPRLHQVAWAKAIEYSADIAISVHKHDDSNIIEVICDKNRRGPKFGFFLEEDIDYGKMVEVFDDSIINTS